MSRDTCGIVVYTWGDRFWLRDDRATGVCDYERYSLFRADPYGRLEVLSGNLNWAIAQGALHCAKEMMKTSDLI